LGGWVSSFWHTGEQEDLLKVREVYRKVGLICDRKTTVPVGREAGPFGVTGGVRVGKSTKAPVPSPRQGGVGPETLKEKQDRSETPRVFETTFGIS